MLAYIFVTWNFIISTSGFQSGAVQYAKKHGIALIQVVDGIFKHISASAKLPIRMIHLLQKEVSRKLPKFFSILWDCETDYPFHQIYPTKEMIQKAQDEVKEQFSCQNKPQP